MLRQWPRKLGKCLQKTRPVTYRPLFECLEDRELPANVFLVTSAADTGSNSLRAAILASNSTAPVNGPNVIDFDIGSGGAQTIALFSALPAITNSVIIDGDSQTGFAGAPLITLDGSGAGAGKNGLTLSGGGSAVYDLAIVNFSGSGIVLSTNGNNSVQGCYLGISSSDVAQGNAVAGILIDGSSHNLVGGTSAAERNIISSNGTGILLVDNASPNGNFNLVEGNYVGTDHTGALARGNTVGILIEDGVSFTTIGGTTAAAANVVSGNQQGVVIQDPGTIGNVVEGNLVGTDATGANWLGNVSDGILIETAQGNIIGGVAPGTGNVVSGNQTNIHLDASADQNVVAGNSVGTNAAGTGVLAGQPAGVTSTGVLIDSSSDNTIGSAATGGGNLISGNGARGVVITGGSASANIIRSNRLGTDKNGLTPASLANGFQDIYVTNAASNSTIGGLATGTGNVITNSGGNGILIGVDATHPVLPGGDTAPNPGTAVLNNSIFGNASAGIAQSIVIQPAPTISLAQLFNGTTLIAQGTLTGALANTTVTLQFFDSPAGSSASGKTYLGSETVTTDGTGNVSFGFSLITSVSLGDVITATATIVANGTSPYSSAATVVTASGSSITLTVSSNGDSGSGTLRQAILDSNANPTSNGQRNRIVFTLGPGSQTIALASALPALTTPVIIDGTTTPGFTNAPLVVLDGAGAGAGVSGLTLTAGNSLVLDLSIINFAGNGIVLSGAGNNTIQGSYVGIDPGDNVHANALDGILIDGSSHNLIGGTTTASRNVLSGNGNAGIEIANATGMNATFNVVQGNFLGTDHTGTSARANSIDALIDAAASFNTIGGSTTAARNVISGSQQGVVVSGTGTTGNAIEGNFIGTNASGAGWLGNTFEGVLFQGASGNTVGGLVAGTGNVVSGNQTNVRLAGNANQNVVAGNSIGTNAAGTALLTGMPGTANLIGVLIDSSVANVIGSIAPGAGNLISGHAQRGVVITGSTADANAVDGNRIGTDKNGQIAAGLGNGFDNVYVTNGATNSTIGDLTPGAGNTIAGSAGIGVLIGDDTANPAQPPTADSPARTGNAILGNSLFGNGGSGIVLGPDGSPNLNQIAPNLAQAQLINNKLLSVRGDLSGTTPDTTYTIQFFASPTGTVGEGQTFLGSESVTTDSGGSTSFLFAVKVSLPAGSVITATATDSANNSSPFSNTVAVVNNFQLDVDGNGTADALTDGILILRFMFGFTGTVLTSGALGSGATRTDPAAITAYLNAAKSTMLDVDANGVAGDALTDGILILRYLFGFTGSVLTSGALGTAATRTDPTAIRGFLDSFNPGAGWLSADDLQSFARLASLALDTNHRTLI